MIGKPCTMITLTSPRWKGETPKQCHDRLRRCIPQLVAKIRRTYGTFEAAIFLEETRSGHPHWHILARCAFIPQRWLSNKWRHLTGAYIVDIRAIDKTVDAIGYVCKYVTKVAARPAAERLGRAVSFTRGWGKLEKKPREAGWFWELLKHQHISEVRERLCTLFDELACDNGYIYLPRTVPQSRSLEGGKKSQSDSVVYGRGAAPLAHPPDT